MLDYLVIAVLTAVALAVGHWLGGSDPSDRTVLAIAAAERHTGMAALIAALNFPDGAAIVMIVIYKIVTLLVMIPYTKWCKKQIAVRSGRSSGAQLLSPTQITSPARTVERRPLQGPP